MSKQEKLILTKDEIAMIRKHRIADQKARERADRQKNCNHHFVYDGRDHNEDVYKCNKCGFIFFGE